MSAGLPLAAASLHISSLSCGICASIWEASITFCDHGNAGFAFDIFALYGSAVIISLIFAVATQLAAATGPSVKFKFTGVIPDSTHA